MAAARDRGISGAMLDRLELTPPRIEAMAAGVETVAAQADPVGRELAAWTMPSGLKIRRVATPLGVIGVIYESRPNVTADAGALCLKAGNAAILRGGSESFESAGAIHACLVAGLEAAGLPAEAIQRVPMRDRAAVAEMLRMTDSIDVIVPRGGKGLVGLVQAEARVPVFAHLEGICHVYLDAAADPAKALAVILNAKTRRTGICGAAECLLIDRASRWAVTRCARCSTPVSPSMATRSVAAMDPRRHSRRPRRTGAANTSRWTSPPAWSTASVARSPISAATARPIPRRC